MKRWMVLLIILGNTGLFSQNTVSFLYSDSHTKSSRKKSEKIDRQVPIEIVRGMVYVEATLNGEQGNFIVDTGSPMMIVNEKPGRDQQQAQGCSGTVAYSATQIRQFELAGIVRNHLDALSLDISHFEDAADREILGMIGYNVLSKYEVYFDYDNEVLKLLKPGKNHLHQEQSPLIVIPFSLADHLPVINVKIGNKTIRMGLDSGAAVNLLDQELAKNLPPSLYNPLEVETVQGLDQQIKKVHSVEMNSTQIDGQAFTAMKYLLTDLSTIQQDDQKKIDGLLGYPFFEKVKFSINYRNQRIYVWAIEQ